jgi:hypothetical protein
MSDQTVFIHDYTEKAIAVFGNTKSYIDEFTKIGGKFNQNLKYNGSTSPGWIFPRTKYQTVKKVVDDINNGSVKPKEYEKKEYVKKEEKKETKVASSDDKTVVLKKEEFMFIMNSLSKLEKELNELKIKVYGEDKSKITAYMKQPAKKQETKKEESDDEESDDEEENDEDENDREEYEVMKSASGRGPCLIRRKN